MLIQINFPKKTWVQLNSHLEVALEHVFSENFGFPCQSTFHLLLHNHFHYHPRMAQYARSGRSANSLTQKKKLPFPSGNICSLAIQRALFGNFIYFLNGLDAILKSVYDTNSKSITCGDINVNYLVDNNKKKFTPCYSLSPL
jgi:hypothetical protein